MSKSTLRDAVFGLAVGDALGYPAQFLKRGSYGFVDKMYDSERLGTVAGTWSDDTSMTLALCASLKNNSGKVDIADITKEFKSWLLQGKYTPDGRAFDIGMTCSAALFSGKGRTGINSNGNGSLMRTIPLAFVDATDEEIAKVSAITHAHEISKRGCVIYVHIARDLLAGLSLEESVEKNVSKDDKIYKNLLSIKNRSVGKIKSSGYIVDTFEAALWSLETASTYRDALVKAVNLGEDTDTIGAVAGALGGIIYGYGAIPKEWISDLRRKDIIESVLF